MRGLAIVLVLSLLGAACSRMSRHDAADASPGQPAATASSAAVPSNDERHRWLPWHWGHHKAADAVVASSASSVAPAKAVSAAAPAPAASSGTREKLASISSPQEMAQSEQGAAAYAPLSAAEWQEFRAAYQALADCEDGYMRGAGVDGEALGQRLAAAGKSAELRATTLRLIGADSSWRNTLKPLAGQPARSAAASVAALMSDGDQAGRTLTQTLERKAQARYYIAFATDGHCAADARYRALLKKASQ